MDQSAAPRVIRIRPSIDFSSAATGAWRGCALAPWFGDLPVTTDYRQVFSELLIRRMGNNRLGQVFPQYAGYAPLGIVQGQDMPPVYGIPPGPRTRLRVPAA